MVLEGLFLVTFNRSVIPTSTMSSIDIHDIFYSEFYDGYFNTVPHSFTDTAFFEEFIMENTIPTADTSLQYHVPYGDLYWHTSIVNADHGDSGFLELDVVYPLNGSKWDGCDATWDYEGTFSVNSDVPESTNTPVYQPLPSEGTFDENILFYSANYFFFAGDVDMERNTINSSSFTSKNISNTVNMSQKHINDSSMVQRSPNA